MRLSERLRGDLVRREDAGFELARQLQCTEYDVVTPQAIAYCETEADVRACVLYAREIGIPVHLRSGGHSFGGWSTGEGLVIDLSRMAHVGVGRDTVRQGAGTQSLDTLAALKRQGRQVITGTFPTVGAAGFYSGGGLGWQTRAFGMGSDRIVSARMVLANGRLARCSADENPDLFWALRGGGGGNFGVITELEVLPIDAPLLTPYEAVWDYDEAVSALTAWQAWCADGPDELGSSLVVLPGMFDPDGRPVVRVWGVHLGPVEDVQQCLDGLIEQVGAKPRSQAVGERAAYADVMHESLCGPKSVAQCHRRGTGPEAEGHRHPHTRRSYRLTNRQAGERESAALLEAWDPERDDERYLLGIAVGGAANRVGRSETAYVHREARFLIGYQFACRGEVSVDKDAELIDRADRASTVLDPLACGSYINFPSSRVREGWESDYYGENHTRLAQVKATYDPDDFFRHQQSISVDPAMAGASV
ncbi:FAD-binding oxidoreductase [Actinomadura sp. 3N508]|uniref:FAD-binding oxidoreductase n=1 Tax=Actinomadura sp. 3N508 TaxID=3375153 RepID=UPI00378BF6A7